MFAATTYSTHFMKLEQALAIAGQTTGPNWLDFFREPWSTPGGNKISKYSFHGQRRALQLVYNKNEIEIVKIVRLE